MRTIPAAALLLLVAAPSGAQEITRTSQPVKPATEAREGWRSPGFRMELQFGWQFLDPLADADRFRTPRGDGFSFGIEPGVRLSRPLAVSVGLRYAAFPGASRRVGDLFQGRDGGVTWSVTGNLTWFPVDQLFLGAGLGYGGLFQGECHANGGAALVRAGAQLVVGESMAMGPTVQAGLSMTRCSSSRSFFHDAVVLAWAFAWR